tara:strand:+ start:642 stop:959 length:318 start_codon:yes stop_codon:yes gene_type:complete
MSLNYEKGLFVRMVELGKGPHPKPLSHGFSDHQAYRVLGIYNPSESGECWLILSNDREEIWYISQRHVRTVALQPDDLRFRVGLLEMTGEPRNQLADPKQLSTVN